MKSSYFLLFAGAALYSAPIAASAQTVAPIVKVANGELRGAVEDGMIILIGATTENPFFEVNSPLLSRSLLFRLEPLEPDRVFIAGRQQPASRRSTRRLRRYRIGAERRISHLKRRYGLGRTRLKGAEGQRVWTEWAILAYNADTLAIRTA